MALAVLVVNDHWAKATFGNVVTGKVSDIAGMVVLPVLLIALTEALWSAGTVSSLRRLRRTRLAALAVSGLLLTAIKLSSAAATGVIVVMETLTATSHAIVVDPTDLIGLTGLVLADRIARRSRPLPLRSFARPARGVVMALGLLACVASTVEEESGWIHLEVDDDGVVTAFSDEPDTSSRRDVIASTDGGLTWSPSTGDTIDVESVDRGPSSGRGPVCLTREPNVCVRTTVDRNDDRSFSSSVEETIDGGLTWTSIWDVPDSKAGWIPDVLGFNASIVFDDIAVLDDDTVLVAAAHLEPIRRDPTTGAWTPTPADVQRPPAVWVLVMMITAMTVVGAVRRLRARVLETLIWLSSSAGIFVFGTFAAGTSVLTLIGASVAFVFLAVLITLTAVSASMKRREPMLDLALRWGSGALVAPIVYAPMWLFDRASLSWSSALTSSLSLMVAAPLVAGFLGSPQSGVRRSKPDPPPPSAPGVLSPFDSGVSTPPPPAASTTGGPELPYALLLLTPLVAVPGALISATLASALLRAVAAPILDIDVIGAIVSFSTAAMLYGAVTAWWSDRVVRESGVALSHRRRRALAIAIVSTLGPIALGLAGQFWLGVAVVFAAPICIMSLGAPRSGTPPVDTTTTPDPPELPDEPSSTGPPVRPVVTPPPPPRRP